MFTNCRSLSELDLNSFTFFDGEQYTYAYQDMFGYVGQNNVNEVTGEHEDAVIYVNSGAIEILGKLGDEYLYSTDGKYAELQVKPSSGSDTE